MTVNYIFKLPVTIEHPPLLLTRQASNELRVVPPFSREPQCPKMGIYAHSTKLGSGFFISLYLLFCSFLEPRTGCHALAFA